VIGNGLGPQIGVDFWQSGVWSPQDTGAVAGPLSCTSASFCLLVGAAYSQTSGDQTFDGYLTFVGTTWNAPVSVSGLDLMSEMSCVNTEFCVATTLSGSIAAFSGTSWTAPVAEDAGQGLTSLTCPAVTYCAALGPQNSVYAASN
jgi:hypothetical protein